MNFFISTWIFLTLLFSLPCAAQLEKTIHHTFNVGEDIHSINLDLFDAFSVEHWAGNSVMTETKIQLLNGTPSVLEHFAEKEKRYLIRAEKNGSSVRLFSADKKREAIKTKNGPCEENVMLKVYIPDNFQQTAPNVFEKRT